MRIWKDFRLNGYKKDENGNIIRPKRDYRLKVYVLIQNLLNTANVYSVYPYTGNPDDDGYLTSAIGEQDVNSQINGQSYTDLYRAFLESGMNGSSGSRYSLPRNIRIGAAFKF